MAKFVSVNLNKSYGQPSSSSSSSSSPYSANVKAGHVSTGGGMVVLSRPRTAQPKLSVPPPLNLPSLRKEHEKFDSTGSSAAAAAASGSASRPNSAGMGWTKPLEKDGTCDFSLLADGVDSTRGNGPYRPPLVPSAAIGAYPFPPEHAMLLRGDDFPSLRSALPLHKLKDTSHKKYNQVESEVSSNEQTHTSPLHMRPQGQSSPPRFANELNENGHEAHTIGSSSTHMADQGRKQDYFPGPLPLVRLNPRSDWADDERDTGQGFADRVRDNGFPKNEAYWDGDFDMPGSSILTNKPPNNLSARWGQHREETGKGSSSEVLKVDPYRRDLRTPSREGKTWKTSPVQKDGLNVQQVVNDRNAIVRPIGLTGDAVKENKYVPPSFGDNSRDTFVRRDMGHGQQGRQHWNQTVDSYTSRGAERHSRDRYDSQQSSRYRGDAFHSSPVLKSSFSSGGKGFSMNDPILNFGREKRAFSKSDRPYVEDPFLKDFGSVGYDERDPLSGGLVGVIKKKKDLVKQADFHDPARESFEAELERVQKTQEMERQRVIEEQERALEQAQREEEERLQMIREEEERRRRVEEEAREAAWRAEQEQMEVIRKAEEQKIAREEEKRRLFIEEERRKHAAKQKLLELEARIAKRRAETENSGGSAAAVIADENLSANVKEKDDLDNWEDSERMVERITTSASSDSSALNRPLGMSSTHPSREGSSGFGDRGKPVNSWKRDVFENGNSSSFLLQDPETGHLSPRRDTSVGGRSFPRKELYGGAGYMSSRTTYFRGVMQEPPMEEFAYLKERRWSPSGDGDLYNRNRDIGSEFYENVAEKHGDVGWGQGQGHSRGNPHSSYPERMYPSSDIDEFYPSGRSRYSTRQPRVLPPPSLPSVHKTSLRGETERPGPSTSLENDTRYNRAERSESTTLQTGSYGDHQEKLESSEFVDVRLENAVCEEQKVDKVTTPRCDSQSSLSVSSPPRSPTQLFHDELDESGESAGEGKEIPLPCGDSIGLNEKSGKDTVMAASNSISASEDEEWSLENNEELQEPEEYDEDEDGYQEDDEVHEGYDENIDLVHQFEDMLLEEKDSSHTENMVLGFNEGVEVGIPGDEFESNSRSEETELGIPEVSAGTVEEQGSKTENGIQDSVSEPINAPTSVSGESDQYKVPYSVDVASHSSSGQAIVSSVSSVPNQADLPVIQFGLFSGPSLIPSLVPAIQIGSIQMPLHLHPPVGPSISHIHPSRPPLFQFGQLRYTSSISQGVLPVAPQSLSFLQPNIQSHYNLNQNSGAALPSQPSQDASSHNLLKNDLNNQSGIVSRGLDLSHENGSRGLKSISLTVDNKIMSVSGFQAEDRGPHDAVVKSYIPSWDDKGSESQSQSVPASQSVSSEKDFSLSKSQVPSASKGKRTAYSVRNSGFRPSFPASEASRSDSSGFQRRLRRPIQRTEFRIRESNNSGLDSKSNFSGKGVGTFTRNGFQRTKPLKQIVESESLSSGPIRSQEIDSESRAGKEALARSQGKRNISEEDVDAPLQSGVVRVFKQPGIEAPSDEDDFIEVRSKRQMLNDRREQREKEIKAKSQATKQPRKPRSSPRSAVVPSRSTKITASLGGETSNDIRSDVVASEGRGLANKDASTGFSSAVSQLLAPIAKRAVNTDTVPVISASGKDIGPSLIFETKKKVLDDVQAPLGSWGNAQISQQVMALTQTQLDEAMKPAWFDPHITSIGGHTTSVSEALLPSSSILTKDKSVSSSASPINSLLAGEKIQFGAVTSPTVLPSSTRVVSHGIGAPRSFRSNIQISHNLSKVENDCTLFFEKDKHPSESCIRLEGCEAEAEAAASAVAASAISSDEIVVKGLGSGSVSDTKSFGGADLDAITGGGGAGDQQSGSRSRIEESLSVSLPADLSVETPPISLWPPLPSPQNPSSHMLSHYPGGPPSHFPFYEMNHPMLGGPIFAFGPHEESGGTQSQSQKSSMSGSGHLGAWQQCHSHMDSFYGPSAGYSGPFISPPGSIPGVQAPPHMVVYNHYAPVGQFGQVGLSFMGTTYVPSGKQPDWKHNPTSSAIGIGEGDMNTMNIGSAQRNPPNMPAPIQHLAPGSPLMPMPSPLALFDVSPFQSAADMSLQPHWSHIPASALHSVPLSLPLQQPAERVVPSNFSHGHPVDQSITPNKFSEPQTSTTVAQFPNEVGLVDSLSSTIASTQGGGAAASQSSLGNTTASAGKTDAVNSKGQSTNAFKTQQQSQQKNSSAHNQYNHSAGYGYQRGGGVSQKNSSSGEWSHRRIGGFHGRNQSMGAEKSFPPSKMKQIYVAKQTPSGTSMG